MTLKGRASRLLTHRWIFASGHYSAPVSGPARGLLPTAAVPRPHRLLPACPDVANPWRAGALCEAAVLPGSQEFEGGTGRCCTRLSCRQRVPRLWRAETVRSGRSRGQPLRGCTYNRARLLKRSFLSVSQAGVPL